MDYTKVETYIIERARKQNLDINEETIHNLLSSIKISEEGKLPATFINCCPVPLPAIIMLGLIGLSGVFKTFIFSL